jgi:hypothetical protein
MRHGSGFTKSCTTGSLSASSRATMAGIPRRSRPPSGARAGPRTRPSKPRFLTFLSEKPSLQPFLAGTGNRRL